MTLPLRNRLRGTEHLDAKSTSRSIADRRKQRTHPTARGGTFEDAELRFGVRFSGQVRQRQLFGRLSTSGLT